VSISIDVNTKCNFILGKTYYVNKDGSANYTRIQDAIDNASDGDTIFVYNGTYFENIIVNKKINLFGENKTSTIIDAKNIGDVVNIIADKVQINGFTIMNSGKSDYPYYEYQGIFVESNGNIIMDNIIYNSEEGIFLNYSYGTMIIGNIIHKCNSHCIKLYCSNINIVKDNSIFNFNYSGITLGISDYNKVIQNNISRSSSYGYGMVLSVAKNNTIKRNSLIENWYGIELNHGESRFNEIMENNFMDNQRNAKFYALKPDSNNIWDGNFWDHARIFPKLIFGTYHFENSRIWLHWFNIDWNPASEAYDI
jgi:parallel beta-helix repeat protein